MSIAENTIVKMCRTAANIVSGRGMFAIGGHFRQDDALRLLALLPPGIRTVIDVGAHTGEFARCIDDLLPSRRILCFEPLRSCQRALRRAAEQMPNLEIFPYALGERNDSVVMHRNAFTPSSSLLPMLRAHVSAFPFTFRSHVERVDMRRLDDVVDSETLGQDILLKIDVQGYEDRVLAGAACTLSGVLAIVIELSHTPLYDGQMLQPEMVALLQNLGFEFRGNCGEIRHTLTGAVLQTDAVFTRRPQADGSLLPEHRPR